MKSRDLKKRIAQIAKVQGVRAEYAEGGSHTKVRIGDKQAVIPRRSEINEIHRPCDPQASGRLTMTTTLTARCTRSDGWWAVEVPEVLGLFTQARRLDQVPVVVLDAASLLTGRPEADFEVTVAPVLDEDDLTVVRDARERRVALVEAERAAATASRLAVAQLRAEGLTVRDVAEIMGLSPQRVSQLVAS